MRSTVTPRQFVRIVQVSISPLPFIGTRPRSVRSNVPKVSSSILVVWLTCIFSASPFDSIRLAVLTVSPNRQYRGIFKPTTPATHGPLLVRPMAYGELVDGRQQPERHAGDFPRVQITVPHRKPGHDHSILIEV
uniref:Uncharacterized protein n=1 Tax=Anopheles merus TaxID=30066 RepID=A0A182UYS4_ANOME